jgi:membrane protease YdiL (CAAX protease family)
MEQNQPESIQPAQDIVGITSNRPALTDGVETVPPPEPVSMRAPWSGLAIVLVWMVATLCVGLIDYALKVTNVLGQWYPPSGPGLKYDESSRTWLMMWATVLASPLQLLGGVLAIKFTSESTLVDMGLTGRRLFWNILLGLALAGPLSLVVYGVQTGSESLMNLLPGGDTQEHLFVRLARQGLTPSEWSVLVVAALVVAPVWEEFLFRGLILPWAMTQRWGGHVLMGLAAILALLARLKPAPGGDAAWFVHMLPIFVLLALVPIHLALDRDERTRPAAALFASAVLFGWFHVSVWPSPVALTLLGLGLGWLRWRSGSLIGPIVLHMTFNAIAVGVLLVSLRSA